MIVRISSLLITSWLLIYANIYFVRDVSMPIYGVVMFLHAFIPLLFAKVYAQKEGISLRYFTKGITSKHMYVWFLGVFVGIASLLVATPFVKTNSFYLVEVFRMIHIPVDAIWWTAPLIFGSAFLLFGFSLWMLIASGQEAFFRIYLMETWKHWSFGKMWLAISTVWFLWLLPIHACNEMHVPLSQVALKCFIYCACLSMILLAFTRNTRELSIPSLFMGMIQAFESGIYLIAPTADRHYYGVTGWVGVGVLFLAALVSYALIRGDLMSQESLT